MILFGECSISLFGVYYDDVYELPVGICDTIGKAYALKRYFECYKGISCKIEIVEV